MDHVNIITGASIALNLIDPLIDADTGTCKKAYGAAGRYIAGSADFVDVIRSYASDSIFTTSLL